MDFFNKTDRDFRNLKKNAVSRAGTEDIADESGGSMTGGDWAGIGLQLLGAVSQQKAQDAEMNRLLREANQNKMNENKTYRDQRGDIEDQKARQAQAIRFQGLNFLNDQIDSNRAMARKRTFRDAMYDTMRA